MNIKGICANMLSVAMLAGVILAPGAVQAQDRRDRDRDDSYRQEDRRDRDRDDNYRRDRDRDRDRDYRQDERQRDRNYRYHRDRDRRDNEYDRRQETKNEWRNIAIGAGGLGVLGLLTHEPTLTFGGAAGALYSLNRYEQDRRSQSRLERTRAEYFSRPYFYRDGQRYNRRTVERHGQRYYQFVRE